jgi:hypothetical protein
MTIDIVEAINEIFDLNEKLENGFAEIDSYKLLVKNNHGK